MDWGDGTYELTAAVLAPVSDVVVHRAEVQPGERVLDVATGTGNAALAAARSGATAVGVDPAERLLHVAGRRAEAEGLVVRMLPGSATALPVGDDEMDAAISVFGVIFAPDGAAVVAELVRVVRPGGRVVLAVWATGGAIHTGGAILREGVSAALADSAPPPPSTDWTDPDAVRRLFDVHRATVDVQRREMQFTAASPTAWFDEQEQQHPIWRGVRALVAGVPGVWEGIRERSLANLVEHNEDASAFAVTSGYWVIRADLP